METLESACAACAALFTQLPTLVGPLPWIDGLPAKAIASFGGIHRMPSVHWARCQCFWPHQDEQDTPADTLRGSQTQV